MNGSLYLKIGKKIKEIRQERKNTLMDVAVKAGVSKSLLSKIENGRTIPSLPVLIQIIRALESDLNHFFADISDDISYGYIHKKAENYALYQKEDSEGFSYYSILSENIQNMVFQSSILKLEPGAKRETVVTDGFTFIYLLEGEINYVLGKENIKLKMGDSLFFDGKIPHVPQNKTNETAILLVIYLINTTKN
jgi:transcriptional regulator with XRE-family HTH domain